MFKQVMVIAAACAALAAGVVPTAHAAVPVRPASNGQYISTYISDARFGVHEGHSFCLTYEGGGDPKDGDFVYMAPCETKPTQVWLIYKNNDNVGFATPLAEPTPLALAQRGRSSATIVIDANKGTNYVLKLIPKGRGQWIFANELYGGRWLGIPQNKKAGRTYLTHWVRTSNGSNVLLQLGRNWKDD